MKSTTQKIISIIVLAVMLMTTDIAAAFAEPSDGEAVSGSSTAAELQETEGTGNTDANVTDEQDESGDSPAAAQPGDAGSSEGDAASAGETTGGSASEADPAATDAETPAADAEAEPEPEPAAEVPKAPVVIKPVKISGFKASGYESGKIHLKWGGVSGASYYMVSMDKYKYRFSGSARSCTLKGITRKHDYTLRAYNADNVLIGESDTLHLTVYDVDSLRKLSNRTIRTFKKFKSNLRSLIKEPWNGYSVVQGGCTDGKYVYQLMISTKTQKGRVLKLRRSDYAVVKRSNIVNVHHGNGMAYDSKRKRLVVIARENRKQEITCIDASTLKITKQQNVKYTHYKNATSGLTPYHQEHGLAAIAYNEKFDCYIALERITHDLIVFNPDNFEAIAYIRTTITEKYPGVYQAMDADDKYVYLLLSSDGDTQKNNVILALDWNSENLLPIVNAKIRSKAYMSKQWKCGNNHDGKPDAAIIVKTPHEAENIFHTKGSSGKNHFYLTEYYNNPVYKTVKVKVKYKVKSGGRYVTKYKKVKKKVVRYYKRDSYVYDLGQI